MSLILHSINMKMNRRENLSIFIGFFFPKKIYGLNSAFVNSGANLLDVLDFDNGVASLMVSTFQKFDKKTVKTEFCFCFFFVFFLLLTVPRLYYPVAIKPSWRQ